MAMAQPQLQFLVGKARAALPILRGAAAQGLSATEALGLVEQAGIRTLRSVIFDIYAALQGRANVAQYLRLTPTTETLPPEAHARAVNPQADNYFYTARVFHPDTGNQQYVIVGSAVPLSEVQIRGSVDAIFATGEKYKVTLEDYPDSTVDIVEATVGSGVP